MRTIADQPFDKKTMGEIYGFNQPSHQKPGIQWDYTCKDTAV
jgi:hypothetical protein